MVEDEFYAVAQTFTRNLHYAEYVRRKKEAKLRNEATIQGISRPTDGVTPMTDETRRRKVSEALSARQKAGLNQTMGKRPRVDSEDERGEHKVEDAEEDGDSLWAGTSLHNLMMSPRSARSLVGLQGVKSSTRAAAGYSQTSNSSRSRTDNAEFSSPLRPQAETPRPVPIEADDDTASEEDDDDLNIPAIKESSVRKPIRQQPQHLQRELKLSRTKPNSPTMRSSHQRSHSITESETRKRHSSGVNSVRRRTSLFRVKKEELFDDFDDFLRDTKIPVEDSRGSSSTDRFSKKDSRDTDSRSKKLNLNEVPTFLVWEEIFDTTLTTCDICRATEKLSSKLGVYIQDLILHSFRRLDRLAVTVSPTLTAVCWLSREVRVLRSVSMGFNPAVVCWESGSNSGKNSGVSLLKLVGGPWYRSPHQPQRRIKVKLFCPFNSQFWVIWMSCDVQRATWYAGWLLRNCSASFLGNLGKLTHSKVLRIFWLHRI